MSTAKYERMRAVATERYDEEDDCGVVALALAAGISYGKSHAVLKRAGRQHRQGTNGLQVQAALDELGIGHQLTRPPPKMTACQYRKSMVGRSIIITKGHASAVVEGIIHDYIGQSSRKYVHYVIELEGKDGV